MLLWSVLHLTATQAVNSDYERIGQPWVSLDAIRRFRQLDSKAPGHPEYHWVSGVETTTGPLGQGIATSVGMAIAEKWLAERYNQPGFDIFDYDIYAICGDGCLMEGVGAEAASLAGHLGLDNLCWVYDNNHITIEGSTNLAFTEDVAARFLGYGWNVLRVGDANDTDRIEHALQVFGRTRGRPTLIILDSHIGMAPHTSRTPPKPTASRSARTRSALPNAPTAGPRMRKSSCRKGFVNTLQGGWSPGRESPAPVDGALSILPDEAFRACDRDRSDAAPRTPDRLGSQPPRLPGGPEGPRWTRRLRPGTERSRSEHRLVRWGSADLGPSNKTTLKFQGAGDFQAESPGGRNLHFGIREHAMGAILNGLSLSKLRPFGATFFIFSDYLRPTIRLSALMELPTVFVFTHDAMGDGEDGPTHQPVEQLASLRAIPGLVTLRPGDANEVVEAYRYVMQLRHQPAVLALSRQPLPTLDRQRYASASGVARGAYVLGDAPGEKPEVILIATGSEVSLAVQAHEKLLAEGIRSRVLSMPSWDIFEHQPEEYRDRVLPPDVKARIAIEQASGFGWERYVGLEGRIIGMRTFGASAPLKELQKKFRFEPERVAAVAKKLVARG